ncbi:hypothetical protein DSLASN_41960 [Desulfoluna limicola]|uniref:VacJ family lipoprotein n=1 Tax=Desulfoluna limicola TaxID=2810562 RepID=A0ABM7PM13_9BACT|nr:VacJ family lipoprotein [Desulfoluna limicola]BCS98564.1 hypothetical protein DSLASN_41960 [Desulfoluna limicola]
MVSSALVVLVVALLLQGCATRSSLPVESPVPAPPESEAIAGTAQGDLLNEVAPLDDEALPDEEAFTDDAAFSDDEYDEDSDFFDDAGLIDEFEETPEVLVRDPLAPLNRLMFSFNDKLLLWGIKPISTGYRAITPTIVRKGVSNFFNNLKTPVRLVSSLLQGKMNGAGSEVGRFVINTTIGVLGFGDPAERWFDLHPSDEDLGQALGAWGLGNGFYIVWPLLGPSTLRDSASIAGYFYLNPVGYVKPVRLSIAISAFEQLNDASFSIEDYETLKASALDPYTFIRDLYIQSRAKKVSE